MRVSLVSLITIFLIYNANGQYYYYDPDPAPSNEDVCTCTNPGGRGTLNTYTCNDPANNGACPTDAPVCDDDGQFALLVGTTPDACKASCIPNWVNGLGNKNCGNIQPRFTCGANFGMRDGNGNNPRMGCAECGVCTDTPHICAEHTCSGSVLKANLDSLVCQYLDDGCKDENCCMPVCSDHTCSPGLSSKLVPGTDLICADPNGCTDSECCAQSCSSGEWSQFMDSVSFDINMKFTQAEIDGGFIFIENLNSRADGTLTLIVNDVIVPFATSDGRLDNNCDQDFQNANNWVHGDRPEEGGSYECFSLLAAVPNLQVTDSVIVRTQGFSASDDGQVTLESHCEQNNLVADLKTECGDVTTEDACVVAQNQDGVRLQCKWVTASNGDQFCAETRLKCNNPEITRIYDENNFKIVSDLSGLWGDDQVTIPAMVWRLNMPDLNTQSVIHLGGTTYEPETFEVEDNTICCEADSGNCAAGEERLGWIETGATLAQCREQCFQTTGCTHFSVSVEDDVCVFCNQLPTQQVVGRFDYKTYQMGCENDVCEPNTPAFRIQDDYFLAEETFAETWDNTANFDPGFMGDSNGISLGEYCPDENPDNCDDGMLGEKRRMPAKVSGGSSGEGMQIGRIKSGTTYRVVVYQTFLNKADFDSRPDCGIWNEVEQRGVVTKIRCLTPMEIHIRQQCETGIVNTPEPIPDDLNTVGSMSFLELQELEAIFIAEMATLTGDKQAALSGLIRAFFHDAGPGALDSPKMGLLESLKDGSASNCAAAHGGLEVALDKFRSLANLMGKETFTSDSHPGAEGISDADFLVMISAMAVDRLSPDGTEKLLYKQSFGRAQRDATTKNNLKCGTVDCQNAGDEICGKLPGFNFDQFTFSERILASHREIFDKMLRIDDSGNRVIDEMDIVALMGAHTVGFVRANFMLTDGDNCFTSPGRGPWTENPGVFDNEYYQILMEIWDKLEDDLDNDLTFKDNIDDVKTGFIDVEISNPANVDTLNFGGCGAFGEKDVGPGGWCSMCDSPNVALDTDAAIRQNRIMLDTDLALLFDLTTHTEIVKFADPATGTEAWRNVFDPAFVKFANLGYNGLTPVIEMPTSSPSTSIPSKIPSRSPETSIPTRSPVTSIPTKSPSRSPVTSIPTRSPVTSIPTKAPWRQTEAPTTSVPTRSPSSSEPTTAPTTAEPTTAPVTTEPTRNPTTSQPSPAPVTTEPTNVPTFLNYPDDYPWQKLHSTQGCSYPDSSTSLVYLCGSWTVEKCRTECDARAGCVSFYWSELFSGICRLHTVLPIGYDIPNYGTGYDWECHAKTGLEVLFQGWGECDTGGEGSETEISVSSSSAVTNYETCRVACLENNCRSFSSGGVNSLARCTLYDALAFGGTNDLLIGTEGYDDGYVNSYRYYHRSCYAPTYIAPPNNFEIPASHPWQTVETDKTCSFEAGIDNVRYYCGSWSIAMCEDACEGFDWCKSFWWSSYANGVCGLYDRLPEGSAPKPPSYTGYTWSCHALTGPHSNTGSGVVQVQDAFGECDQPDSSIMSSFSAGSTETQSQENCESACRDRLCSSFEWGKNDRCVLYGVPTSNLINVDTEVPGFANSNYYKYQRGYVKYTCYNVLY